MFEADAGGHVCHGCRACCSSAIFAMVMAMALPSAAVFVMAGG